MDEVDKRGLQKMEMKDMMDRVHIVKIEEEIKNTKMAASFVEWTFGEIINEIEDIVDGEK